MDRTLKIATIALCFWTTTTPTALAYELSDIVGTWSCKVLGYEAGITADYVETVSPGGESFFDGDVQIVEANGESEMTIDIRLTNRMQLSVSDSEVTEDILEVNVSRMLVNGEVVPDSMMRSLEESLLEEPNGFSEILYADEETLIRRGSDDLQACVRK